MEHFRGVDVGEAEDAAGDNHDAREGTKAAVAAAAEAAHQVTAEIGLAPIHVASSDPAAGAAADPVAAARFATELLPLLRKYPNWDFGDANHIRLATRRAAKSNKENQVDGSDVSEVSDTSHAVGSKAAAALASEAAAPAAMGRAEEEPAVAAAAAAGAAVAGAYSRPLYSST
jgi:hypothetical protein